MKPVAFRLSPEFDFGFLFIVSLIILHLNSINLEDNWDRWNEKLIFRQLNDFSLNLRIYVLNLFWITILLLSLFRIIRGFTVQYDLVVFHYFLISQVSKLGLNYQIQECCIISSSTINSYLNKLTRVFFINFKHFWVIGSKIILDIVQHERGRWVRSASWN